MRTSDVLAHAVARLAIPDEVMARHVEAVEAAGYREPDALARLYREWLNDSLAAFGTPRFDAAATAPATDFASWLVGRLPDPYRVTVRAHDTVRARFGDEVAIAMSSVVWRQEIAWASRMRGDDNARVACLAELWLRAARRDPAHMFKGIAEIRAQEMGFNPEYRESACHFLGEDEILDMEEIPGWSPLWLLHADREFGKLINDPTKMPRVRLDAMAAQLRDAEKTDRIRRARSAQAESMRQHRPALMTGVISAACQRGLSSDDLVAAENSLIADVKDGKEHVSSVPGWRKLVARLEGWAGMAPPPGEDECRLRIEAIQQLAPNWADRLPPDFGRFGCRRRESLLAWYDAVVDRSRRTPPIDPAVDYGMWLIENARQQGVRIMDTDPV